VRASGAGATKGRGPRPPDLLIMFTTYHTYPDSEILNVLLSHNAVSINLLPFTYYPEPTLSPASVIGTPLH
jgi:hypothetical protein